MERMAKKITLTTIITILLIGGVWYFLITSYTPELTTENEIDLADGQDELTELVLELAEDYTKADFEEAEEYYSDDVKIYFNSFLSLFLSICACRDESFPTVTFLGSKYASCISGFTP